MRIPSALEETGPEVKPSRSGPDLTTSTVFEARSTYRRSSSPSMGPMRLQTTGLEYPMVFPPEAVLPEPHGPAVQVLIESGHRRDGVAVRHEEALLDRVQGRVEVVGIPLIVPTHRIVDEECSTPGRVQPDRDLVCRVSDGHVVRVRETAGAVATRAAGPHRSIELGSVDPRRRIVRRVGVNGCLQGEVEVRPAHIRRGIVQGREGEILPITEFRQAVETGRSEAAPVQVAVWEAHEERARPTSVCVVPDAVSDRTQSRIAHRYYAT